MAKLEKPHVVCIPFPAQGHINPMLKLAKLLHYEGFHITFVNTEFNHKRLIRSQGLNSLTGVPSFRFEAIPDGLPESDPDATQDIPSLCESCNKNCSIPFKDLLSKLNDSAAANSSNVPPVTCIISDAALPFTVALADQLGIPDVVFWTASVCGLMGYVQYRNLIEKGYTPLKDVSYLTNGYLDTVIEGIPGMEGIRLKDFPSFIRSTDPNDFMTQYALAVIDNITKASAIIFNTFDELEHEVLKPLSSIFPPIYTIGPLNLLMNQIEDDSLKMLGSNLWKEEPQCLEWLDSNGPNSVVYVNFGSITVMTPNQLVEFAWGLANSSHAFLWIIRPDLVSGRASVLPPEFLEVTKDRGLLASWCPQEKVLAHPSIGGFLTHSGWNSTLESISSGVPMVCWPFFSEQQTNCWFSCAKWGVGMEIDRNVRREKVEDLVRELMVGEKGKAMKRRAIEWKRIAGEATQGSSCSSLLNLDKLINQVLPSPRHKVSTGGIHGGESQA